MLIITAHSPDIAYITINLTTHGYTSVVTQVRGVTVRNYSCLGFEQKIYDIFYHFLSPFHTFFKGSLESHWDEVNRVIHLHAIF